MFEMLENAAINDFMYIAISGTILTFWKFLVWGHYLKHFFLHEKIKLFPSSNLCVLCISFDGIDIFLTPNKHACKTSTVDPLCKNKIYNLKL